LLFLGAEGAGEKDGDEPEQGDVADEDLPDNMEIDGQGQGEEGGEEDEISPGMREAMTSFKGPKGEVPVWVSGSTDDPYYDFEVTMSDGSIFRMYYRSFYDPQILSLERDGVTYELDEERREQVEEVLANHGDWSRYLHDALWMLLDTANGN
jgi:hypothetical protein